VQQIVRSGSTDRFGVCDTFVRLPAVLSVTNPARLLLIAVWWGPIRSATLDTLQ